MIIVMDNGYELSPAEYGKIGNSLFNDVLINEVIRMIDSRFRTIAHRSNSTIAGLSMGAKEYAALLFK